MAGSRSGRGLIESLIEKLVELFYENVADILNNTLRHLDTEFSGSSLQCFSRTESISLNSRAESIGNAPTSVRTPACNIQDFLPRELGPLKQMYDFERAFNAIQVVGRYVS